MARKKNKTNKLISVIEQREKLIEVEQQLRLESLSEFGKLVLDNLEPGRDRKNYERFGKNCSGTKRCAQENILTISLPRFWGKKCNFANESAKILDDNY
jgi:hypothetical protein